MPFTLAHTAVAPPMVRLSGGRLVVSALVVGSMAPDFQSLVALNSNRTLGHTLPGLFSFCLPVTLAVLVVWHAVVKRPLASLLPARMAPVAAVAGRPFPLGPSSRFLTVCLSALAGSFSHIAWDAFTHEDGFFVERVRLLSRPIHWHGLAIFDLLQYGSGLFGLVLLGIWWHRWTLAHAPSPMPALPPTPIPVAPLRVRWTAVSTIALVSASGGAANALRTAGLGAPLREVVSHAVLGTMAGSVVAALLVAALLSRRRP